MASRLQIIMGDISAGTKASLQYLKECTQKLQKNIKEYQEIYIGVGTIYIGGMTIAMSLIAANLQVEATIQAAEKQAQATMQAADDTDKQREEILSKYVERVKDLLDDKGFNAANRELIRTQSFTTLRTVDGQGKGYLVRFLNEYGLTKANQPGLSLSGADLRKINLQDAWLPDINLKGAYLTGGNLHNANLKRANLEGANLKDANLEGADLTSVNLIGADLTNANLTNATGTNLIGAKLCHTTMPDGNQSDCQ